MTIVHRHINDIYRNRILHVQIAHKISLTLRQIRCLCDSDWKDQHSTSCKDLTFWCLYYSEEIFSKRQMINVAIVPPN